MKALGRVSKNKRTRMKLSTQILDTSRHGSRGRAVFGQFFVKAINAWPLSSTILDVTEQLSLTQFTFCLSEVFIISKNIFSFISG